MDHLTSAQHAAPGASALDADDLRHIDTGVRPGVPGAADAAATVICHRSRIDEIDRQLIELIRERISVSGKVQTVRMHTGGIRMSLSRETQIIGRYRKALGRLGTDVAISLLRLSRATANSEQRGHDEIRISRT